MLQIESGEKECRKCHAKKSLSEFYQRKNTDDNPLYYSYCKACTYDVSSKGKTARVEPANELEKLVAAHLAKRGIPVSIGKHSCDLLLFGCLTVEVKKAMEYYTKAHNETTWRCGFTTNQLTRRIDIIAIVDDNGEFLFFDGMNPKWFKDDGTRWQGKIFRVFADKTDNLNATDVQEPLALIHQKLQERCAEIKNGTFDVMKDI